MLDYQLDRLALQVMMTTATSEIYGFLMDKKRIKSKKLDVPKTSTVSSSSNLVEQDSDDVPKSTK